MDWTRAIDVYCERVSAAFWAEPFNALTNIAFIVAGLAAIHAQGRKGGAGQGRELAAAALMACAIVALLSQAITTAWALSTSIVAWPLVIGSFSMTGVFLVVGLIAQPRFWTNPGPNWPLAWLGGNAMVVGVGSFLFHTFAMPWAAAADTGPILLFILGYFTVTMNRFAGLSWRGAAIATTLFLIGMILLSGVLRQTIGPYVGGSQSYFPALFALFGIGLWLERVREHPAGRQLMLAGGVFALSLTFRTMDGPLCDLIPIGTHFLWHLCNALVFWILLRALVAHGRLPDARLAPA
ncbi:MAG: hypothetical protein AAGI34_04240 [Pseudomonadota bacterium]